MITSKQAYEIEAIRGELDYAVQEFNSTLNLIEEDIAMLREAPNEVDFDSLYSHMKMLDGEFSTLRDLDRRVECYERAEYFC